MGVGLHEALGVRLCKPGHRQEWGSPGNVRQEGTTEDSAAKEEPEANGGEGSEP